MEGLYWQQLVRSQETFRLVEEADCCILTGSACCLLKNDWERERRRLVHDLCSNRPGSTKIKLIYCAANSLFCCGSSNWGLFSLLFSGNRSSFHLNLSFLMETQWMSWSRVLSWSLSSVLNNFLLVLLLTVTWHCHVISKANVHLYYA